MSKITVKDRVLSTLCKDYGTYHSGQEIAEALHVTRAAVWKAIGKLREEGYEIDGTTNRGYALMQNADALSEETVRAFLNPEAAAFFRVECVAVTGSTNNDLKVRGQEGEPEGLVIAAEAQTAGKGRQGRSFYSPKNTGLYFSLLLRPELNAQDAVLITAAAAAVSAKACEKACDNLSFGDISIKWVNDLYLNGRKVAGILTEGALSIETAKLDYAVLGIGFNLYTPAGGWPEEIRDVAGSLVPESAEAVRQKGLRSRIVAEFLNEFLPVYRTLAERSFLEEYAKRQMVVGREVEVMAGDPPYRTALAIGVDADCHLLVHYPEDPENELHALNSGEVRIKPLKR